MSVKITYVISDSGDGSQAINWVTDQKVLDKMQELADAGDSSYASGDGLQKRELYFPDGFDLDAWVKVNHISLTTLEDVDRDPY